MQFQPETTITLYNPQTLMEPEVAMFLQQGNPCSACIVSVFSLCSTIGSGSHLGSICWLGDSPCAAGLWVTTKVLVRCILGSISITSVKFGLTIYLPTWNLEVQSEVFRWHWVSFRPLPLAVHRFLWLTMEGWGTLPVELGTEGRRDSQIITALWLSQGCTNIP